MTADYQLELTISGSPLDIKSILEVIGHYRNGGDKPAYFSCFTLNGKSFDFESELKDITMENVSNGKVEITASGPWGRYNRLNDVDIFREMAESAPNSTFEAEISGYGQYSVENLKCELKDKKLRILDFYEDNGELLESWCKYFAKKIPFEMFVKLFMISGEDELHESYSDVLEELYDFCRDGYSEMEYEDFVTLIEEYGGETEIEEDRFCEIMENDLSSLGVSCPVEYEEEYEPGEKNEYIYDPIKKEYEGTSKPLFEGGQIQNVDDLISLGLEKQGLSGDDKTVTSLSVEDAYKALGAALGISFGDDEDPYDDDDDE